MRHGYAATTASGPLAPYSWDPGPLGEDEVEVEVEVCGLCHSDASMLRNEWGIARYPLVPGHEVIGRVAALGSAARGLRVGDRVGIGWQSRSCGACSDCRAGDEVFCAVDNGGTITTGHGGFADRLRVHHRFAVPVPAALSSAEAAPLMCAGITVFTPFVDYGVRAGMSVGVVGIGGLGHLALQFARAMGCEVTAFTTSPDKADEARGFGAHHVVATRGPDLLAGLARRFDFILNTVSGDIDWAGLIGTLRPRGTLVTVGVPASDICIPAFPLIMSQARLGGSPIGSPLGIARMLDFAAAFGVRPKIEVMPMSRVNDAIARLDANQARYRIVLEAGR